jgi:hypothetical protein
MNGWCAARKMCLSIHDLSVRWTGKIEKGGRVLISFFLNGFLLESKSMSLLMVDFINHDHLLEVNLGFHKYADGGPIINVPVR